MPLDVFCVDETKLDDSFSNPQFILEIFQFPPFRRDRHSKGGGKLVYIKQGIIAKILESLETKFSQTICIELTISKKKMVCFIYDNYIITEDLNINSLDPKCDGNSHFYDLKDKGTPLDVLSH